MAKSEKLKQLSETWSVLLLDREVELFYGLANALAKQGVPIMNPLGKPIKNMLIRESFRIAAEVVGGEIGDKKLVALARQLKQSFRSVRVPDNSWRRRLQRRPGASAARKGS